MSFNTILTIVLTGAALLYIVSYGKDLANDQKITSGARTVTPAQPETDHILPSAPSNSQDDEQREIQLIDRCARYAGLKYKLNSSVLYGILDVDPGVIGKEQITPDGVLLGLMKIDSKEVAGYAVEWKAREEEAYRLIKDDPCTGMSIVASAIKSYLVPGKSLADAIGDYGAAKGKERSEYMWQVVSAIKSRGWATDYLFAPLVREQKSEWEFLVYDMSTLIRNPVPMNDLKSCLQAISAAERQDRRFSIRYLCQERRTGALYASTGQLRKAWDPNIPKEIQMGRKAPWVD